MQISKGEITIVVRRQLFGQILKSSDLILAMAGTATEQAVGIGKPVLQVVGQGPQFTSVFADAQRRLLGSTVFCSNGSPGCNTTLKETAKMAIQILKKVKSEPGFQTTESEKVVAVCG